MHKISDSYPENELLEAFKGIDAIVATTVHTAPEKDFIAAAAKAGVKRYLPSEFGSDSRDPKVSEVLPMFQSKIDTVEYLKAQEGTGLSWTSVCTGPFLDWYVFLEGVRICWVVMLIELNRGLTSGFLGFSIPARKATIYGGGDTVFTTTTLPAVGAAVVGVLRKPEETANKYVFVSSARTTGNELLATLEKVSGEKWEVEHRSIEETIRAGQEKMGKGDYSGIVDLIVGSIYGLESSDVTRDHELANGLLGLPEESLVDIVEKVLKE